MRAKPVSSDEQYRLILECRASGLSDYQWCKEHEINPGTFYTWINRLRRKGCSDIPTATRGQGRISNKQEVVKLDIPAPPAEIQQESCVIPTGYLPTDQSLSQDTFPSQPVIEVALFGATIRIPQGADNDFMERVIRTVKAISC